MQNFREFLEQNQFSMTPLQEEFLKSFDQLCLMNEGAFWGGN